MRQHTRALLCASETRGARVKCVLFRNRVHRRPLHKPPYAVRPYLCQRYQGIVQYDRTLREDDGRGRPGWRQSLYRALNLAAHARRGKRIIRGDLAEVEDEAQAGRDHEAEGECDGEYVQWALAEFQVSGLWQDSANSVPSRLTSP